MTEGLSSDQLVLIKLSQADSKTQLDWKHSKEFEYQGQMYDVVRSEVKNDCIYYWCWWDHKETSLNKTLNALSTKAAEKDPLQQENRYLLKQFFKMLYFEECQTLVLRDIKGTPKVHFEFCHNYKYEFHFIPSHPPELNPSILQVV